MFGAGAVLEVECLWGDEPPNSCAPVAAYAAPPTSVTPLTAATSLRASSRPAAVLVAAGSLLTDAAGRLRIYGTDMNELRAAGKPAMSSRVPGARAASSSADSAESSEREPSRSSS